MIYYTADTHFNHQNIIKFCPNTRKFDDVKDMNQTIVNNWNSKVKVDDTIFILGDMFFGKDFSILNQLNGKKILIQGNHDKKLLASHRNSFDDVKDILTVKDGDQTVVLCHYRMYEWDGFYRNTLHFHGHSHGNLISTKRAIDVGLDNPSWNFFPVTMDEIKNMIKNYPDHPPLV